MRRRTLKKGRKNQSQSVFNEESLHFRLCHACWHLNESSSEVIECERCHRLFPSQFSRELLAIAETETYEDAFSGKGLSPREFWEEEDDIAEDDESGEGGEFRQKSLGLTGLSVRW